MVGEKCDIASGYLFIIPWSLEYQGGVNEVVHRLYDELRDSCDYHPYVLIPRWENKKLYFTNIADKKTFFLRLQEPPILRSRFTKETLLYNIRRPLVCQQLVLLLKTHNIGVVNAHFPGLLLEHFANIKRKKLYEFKFILSFHGSDIVEMKRSESYMQCMQRILLEADGIVAPSKDLAGKLKKLMPQLSSKIHVIYNGVDKRGFSAQGCHHLPSAIFDSDQKFALHVGAFEEVKAHDVLLKAWKLLSKKYNNLRLLLIGRRGKSLSDTRLLIASLGLTDRVTILTDVPHSQVAVFMAQSEMILLPSRAEGGLPLVLFEAGVFKKPVVASRIGGIPELIVHDVNGLLVDVGDVNGLVVAIEALLDNDSYAESLGQKLHDLVTENFSWNRTASEYVKMISGF